MSYKNLIARIMLALIALLMPILLFAYSFNSTAFSEDFYKKEFLKHGVYNNLGYDADKINGNVLDYLKHGKNNALIGESFFGEREKLHLLDVKSLIQKMFFAFKFSILLLILLFLAVCFLFGFKFRKIIEKIFLAILLGSFLVLAVGILSLFLWNLDFYFIFSSFHEVFFPEGTYSFNPNFEKIVVLYPENLFFDALSQIFLKTILSSAILVFLILMAYWIFFNAEFLKILSKFSVGKAKK